MTDATKKNAIRRFIDRNPGRMSGITVMVGDLSMTWSGIMFNNWGRLLSSTIGLIDNLPQIIAGDKFDSVERLNKKPDAQDAKGLQRLKFWRYPWEISATSSLWQGITGTFLAAPDTISSLANIVDFQTAVSVNEAMRPLEFLSGLSCIAGCLVMYVREASDAEVAASGKQRLGGYKSLREEFAMAGHYLRKSWTRITETGPVRAWNETIRDISIAGPNAVAARPLQVGLPLLTMAGLMKGDWNMVASGIAQRDVGQISAGLGQVDWSMVNASVAFMVSNAFLAKSTKRVIAVPAPV